MMMIAVSVCFHIVSSKPGMLRDFMSVRLTLSSIISNQYKICWYMSNILGYAGFDPMTRKIGKEFCKLPSVSVIFFLVRHTICLSAMA